MSSHSHQTGHRQSDASIETLPPEPVQSNPSALHFNSPPQDRSSSSRPATNSYAPSVLSLLQTTHRYSSYVFSGFLGLHALNTCIIPLTTLFSSPEIALSKIDNGFMITRYIYRPSGAVEIGLVLAPLGIHIACGLLLRGLRIFSDRDLYGEGVLSRYRRHGRNNRAKGLSWPRIRALPTLGFSDIAASGYVTGLCVALHAYTVRYAPWKYAGDGETSINIVTYALQKHPVLFYTLYYTLISAGAFHVISGWGKWLRLTLTPRARRIKNYIVTAVNLSWLAALIRNGRLDIFGQTLRMEYDALYRHVWSAF